jgi:hypothetical protein
MLAHGSTIPLMVELVRAGLATATAERVVAGKRTPWRWISCFTNRIAG